MRNAAVDSFRAECDRASLEGDDSELFDETIIGDHVLIKSSDDPLDDNSSASTWLNLTAREQAN